ncbi:hypothetical protein BH09SUM1_BH09SUM1_00200 [soil metagenome]
MNFASNAQRIIAAALILAASQGASAHVIWTQGNSIDPDCRALYHFTAASTNVGDHILPASPEPSTEEFVVAAATAGPGASLSTDTAFAFLGTNSLKLQGTQTIDTQGNVLGGNLGQSYLSSNDSTVEFWFKWDVTTPSQTLRVGLSRTAKILIVRDNATPANDRFGIEFTHSDFVSAPGFTNWGAADPDEAALGDWHHAAFTIHSTGITFDSLDGHDKFNAGSTAIIWLSGHPQGASPFTVSVTGMRAHDASKVRIQTDGTSAVFIDELTIWSKDLSNNGALLTPFANGRGTGSSPMRDWAAY